MSRGVCETVMWLVTSGSNYIVDSLCPFGDGILEASFMGFPQMKSTTIDQYQSDKNSLSSVRVLCAQQTKPSEACKGGVREDESLGRHKPDLIDAHHEKHVHAVTYRQFTWGTHYFFHLRDIPSGRIPRLQTTFTHQRCTFLDIYSHVAITKKRPPPHQNDIQAVIEIYCFNITGCERGPISALPPGEALRKHSQHKRNYLLLRSLLFFIFRKQDI